MCFRNVMLAMLLLCGAATGFADDAAIRSSVLRFLESAWQTGDTAKRDADEKYVSVEKVAGADARALYGHALVMMYQRRYDEAMASLDRVLRVDERHLSATRAKIWLALLTKDYGVALPAIERLGSIVSESIEDAENRDELDDAARFLGAVLGFLRGPIGDIPSLVSLERTESDIVKSVSEEQRKLFKEAQQSVMEKFTSLTEERADSREQAIADAEADKQKTLDEIEDRRADMGEQAAEMKERRDKLQKEFQDQLDQIARDDRPLQLELGRLQGRVASAQREVDDLVFDIGRLEARLALEREPVRRAQIRADIAQLSILLRRADGDLAGFAAQIAAVQGERSELAARQAQVQRTWGGQIQRIDRQFAALGAEQRRLAGAEKKARKPSTGSTGKVNALSLTATALKTYEPFPLEQERQRLMDSLRAKPAGDKSE